MISHRYKCIFVHIPKTGGTSIEKVLEVKRSREALFGWDSSRELVLQHLTANQMLEHDLIPRETFDEYFKFAFIRNPFDLVISEWIWRTRKDKFSLFSKYRWTRMPLRVFLSSHLQGRFKGKLAKRIQIHLTPQYEYTHDRQGNNLMDFTGRFENLEKDLNELAGKLGFDAGRLPHARKSSRRHYSHYYDEETRGMVEKMYRNDLEYFGYNFQAS
jgi:hypothetical protein